MCTKYHSWMAFNKGFFLFTLYAKAPAAANADDARSTRTHDKCHHSQCCTDAFLPLFFCCINIPGVSNTPCTSLFCPPFFFFLRVASPSGHLLFHVVYRLYFGFFFVMREDQSRCIHHYHPSPPLLSTFMRYTFITTFPPCTHLNPLGHLLSHTRLPFGYPGMTDTYDACTPSTSHPFTNLVLSFT